MHSASYDGAANMKRVAHEIKAIERFCIWGEREQAHTTGRSWDFLYIIMDVRMCFHKF